MFVVFDEVVGCVYFVEQVFDVGLELLLFLCGFLVYVEYCVSFDCLFIQVDMFVYMVGVEVDG